MKTIKSTFPFIVDIFVCHQEVTGDVVWGDVATAIPTSEIVLLLTGRPS